jgi:hypothetical protein
MEAILFGILLVISITGVLIVAAIDDLNNNLAQLKTDVEAYIASKSGAVPAAQVEAAASAVAALDAEVKAAP